MPSHTCEYHRPADGPCLESRGRVTSLLSLQRRGKGRHSQRRADDFTLVPVQRLTSCCFHSANNSQRVGPFAVFRLLRVLPWSTLLRPPPLKWFLILEVRCPSMFALTGIWTLSSSARRFSKRGSGNSERWSDLSKISQSCPQSLASSPLLLLMSTALCISSACYPC